jgi:hypothetical protein
MKIQLNGRNMQHAPGNFMHFLSDNFKGRDHLGDLGVVSLMFSNDVISSSDFVASNDTIANE